MRAPPNERRRERFGPSAILYYSAASEGISDVRPFKRMLAQTTHESERGAQAPSAIQPTQVWKWNVAPEPSRSGSIAAPPLISRRLSIETSNRVPHATFLLAARDYYRGYSLDFGLLGPLLSEPLLRIGCDRSPAESSNRPGVDPRPLVSTTSPAAVQARHIALRLPIQFPFALSR